MQAYKINGIYDSLTPPAFNFPKKYFDKTLETKKVFLVLHPRFETMTTEEQILKGAEELFFRYGIKGITMDDVAKHLSMSKRTIYEKFPNKDVIVETLLKQHLDKHLNDCKKFSASSANAIEEIFMMLQPLKELFESMNPRLLLDMRKFHPHSWEEFVKFKR